MIKRHRHRCADHETLTTARPSRHPPGGRLALRWSGTYAFWTTRGLTGRWRTSSALQDGAAAAAKWVLMHAWSTRPGMPHQIKGRAGGGQACLSSQAARGHHRADLLQAGTLREIAETSSARRGPTPGLLAYAMNTAIQRSAAGERVTREEWVVMSELNEAMTASMWTSSQFLPVVVHPPTRHRACTHIHPGAGSGLEGRLPEGLVSISMATGPESIRQTSEHQNLLDWAKEGQGSASPAGSSQ